MNSLNTACSLAQFQATFHFFLPNGFPYLNLYFWQVIFSKTCYQTWGKRFEGTKNQMKASMNHFSQAHFGIVTKRHWSNNITIHCCISSSEAIRWSFIVQFALISENGNCQWCKPLSAWINAVLWRTVGTDKPLFTLKVFNCSFNDFHFSSESFWPIYLVSFSSWDSGVCC